MRTLDKYHPEPCLSLPEEAWCRIEHTLRLDKPDVGLRCRIARYVVIHFLGLTAGLPRIRVGLLRKHLKRIRQDAARLRSDFEISSDDNDEEWAQYYALELIQDGTEREARKSSLSDLIARADDALRLMPRGGRPSDERYRNLILALATTYKIATNEEPTISYYQDAIPDLRYRSKFFDFVVSVFDALGDKMAEPHNNQALGQKTNRALKARRETMGA